MATLVLSSVGTALGGPVGGAIGALLGQSLDQQVFGAGPRHGPRLGDLGVQTSTYGTPVPRIYGTMRVAGSVIWATELKESSQLQGGSKSQPDALAYSYSASFAVALSSRVARGVKRIWADGKLLRGAAGDFKVKTGFRFHPGSEDQTIDPLIAAIEGIGSTPAYRGLALAVFEDLELAEFGNRIPFLTFEVIADDGVPTLGEILESASDGLIAADAAEPIAGYAAYGRNRRSALEQLIEQFGAALFDDGAQLRQPASAPALLPGEHELGCTSGSDKAPREERSHAPVAALPRSLALSYYDPARDYQTGLMRADAGCVGGTDEAIELAAVISADRAKAIAENVIARRWGERERLTLRLPPAFLDIEPGRLVALSDSSLWRVKRTAIEQMVARIELERVSALIAAAPADAGRVNSAPDAQAAPTALAIFDLPDFGTTRRDALTLHVAACQTQAPWRPVPIEISALGETGTASSARDEAVIGNAATVLATGQAMLLDLSSSVDVELADEEHWLESRDDDALVNGANLAVLGSELIQFGSAVALGPRKFRLSRLLRGRRGTEWAIGSHGVGEPFALLAANALQPVELPIEAAGTSVSVKAAGLGDEGASAVQIEPAGEALRPPGPVHLRGAIQADSSLRLGWVRRSRAGWAWLDGIEPPLGESAEKYRVEIIGSAGTFSADTTEPQLIVAAAALAALGAGDAAVTVVQVGDYALSRPAVLLIQLAS